MVMYILARQSLFCFKFKVKGDIPLDVKRHEELKKRVLMYVCRSKLPVTPTLVMEDLDMIYSTVQGILYELTLEGMLKVESRGCVRYFFAVPDKTLTVKSAQ
jgi:hypothetical protein